MPTTKHDADFADEMSQNVDRVIMSNTSLDAAIDWIQNKLTPDDVFTDKQLDDWATSNGYVKE